MATPAAEQLTEEYRRRLQRMRAVALAQTIRLYPTWQGDDDSFPVLLAAWALLLKLRRRDNARLAGSFYEALRLADGVPGRQPVLLAGEDDNGFVDAMYLEGLIRKKKAVRRGIDPDRARKDALVRMSTVMLRSIDNAARETIQQTVKGDPRAEGFVRIARPRACEYCLERAGRVLFTDEDNGYHRSCGCVAVPAFRVQ
jgi:hypothetical protein